MPTPNQRAHAGGSKSSMVATGVPPWFRPTIGRGRACAGRLGLVLMRRSVTAHLGVLFVGMLYALAGCGGQGTIGVQKISGQDSPPAVLKKMYYAAMDKDKQAFLECFYSPAEYEGFLDMWYEQLAAKADLIRAIDQAYGPEGVKRFKDGRSAQAGWVFFAWPPLDKEIPWWEEVEYEVSGHIAWCKDLWSWQTWKMVEENGVWRMELSAFPEIDARTIYGWPAVRAFRKCTKQVGKPGVTVDDIRRMLGEEIDATGAELVE